MSSAIETLDDSVFALPRRAFGRGQDDSSGSVATNARNDERAQ
jgi:hypothetical protein